MDKIRKILLSLTITTLLLPFIFQREIHLMDRILHKPRLELVLIPATFLILLALHEIWFFEIQKLFKDDK